MIPAGRRLSIGADAYLLIVRVEEVVVAFERQVQILPIKRELIARSLIMDRRLPFCAEPARGKVTWLALDVDSVHVDELCGGFVAAICELFYF